MSKLEHLLLDNLMTSVLLFDADMRLEYINPAGEMLFELSAKNMIGSKVSQLEHCPLGFAKDRISRALHEQLPFTERGVILKLPDKEVTVDCTAIPLTSKEHIERILIELQRVDRQLRINKEEQLVAQQKATTAVVRNLAHEIKNPLGGLRGAAQLLQSELPDPSQKEYTQIIIEEADRLQNLVNRMLGPNKVPSYEPVNIHQTLERVRQLIMAEKGSSIQITRDYDPSIPDLWADSHQLIQALLNIAGNAAKALGEEGEIIFRTRVQRQYTLGSKNRKLVLQADIEDNGPGIPKDIQDRIFFPMVTGTDDGAGLGLSIAQSLINQHGGID